ncbi:TetR/AcrR family transcriptional regulator [Sagittula sp. S175]|uniref:TetR/AcrR family transcriptional regulator n=1 Tax=Sagittula sp. S175 TaxID=3415129 RepID=UPI003C79C117
MDVTQTDQMHGTQATWLRAAYDVLCDQGVEAVKIMPLARSLGLTRSGFYYHFTDREALLEAMIRHWEDKNTGTLEARCDAYAETVCEAIFNLFDCWLDNDLFDSPLDLAIRNWARNDPALQTRLDAADKRRQAAMERIFLRFGYSPQEAETRALTMIFVQIGYISMRVTEPRDERLARMPPYIVVFTGQEPTPAEIDRFMARHCTPAA